MAVRNFRDLVAWQKSVDLVTHVYRLTSAFPDEERWGLVTQIRRAAVSIPANIAEGHGRSTAGDFLFHLSVARGSLNELRSLLDVSQQLGIASNAETRAVDDRADEVARVLWGLRRSTRNRQVAASNRQ